MNANNEMLTKLAAAVAAFVKGVKTGTEASDGKTSAVQAVRELAVTLKDEPKQVRDDVAIKFNADAVKAGVKAGTARPMKAALLGYLVALDAGTPIMDGHGEKGDKPLTAPDARKLYAYSLETPEEKAERETKEKASEARKAIVDMLAGWQGQDAVEHAEAVLAYVGENHKPANHDAAVPLTKRQIAELNAAREAAEAEARLQALAGNREAAAEDAAEEFAGDELPDVQEA